jgi:hypothetical protein
VRGGRVELLLEENREIGGHDISQNQSSRRNVPSDIKPANHFRNFEERTVRNAYAPVVERRPLADGAARKLANIPSEARLPIPSSVRQVG